MTTKTTPAAQSFLPTGTRISGSISFGSYSMERLSRPFRQFSSKLPEPPRTPPPEISLGGETDATLRWGQESSFSEDPPKEDVNADLWGAPGSGTSGSKVNAGDKKTPAGKRKQDKKKGVEDWDEIDRQVETVTVYNPRDNTQYVNEQRILASRYRNREDGRIMVLHHKNPPPPAKPADAA